jgi:hypothetical protein
MNEMALKALDSSELAFFKKQLELILTKVYETKYPQLSARSMFPVSPEGGEGIDSVSYEIWDGRGIADFVAAYAGDIPRADVSSRKVTSPVHRMAECFGMTLDEIKKSNRTGAPLSDRKAKEVRKGHEEKLNQTAFYGNTSLGLMGLFSHPSILNGAAPTLDWDDSVSPATTDEILACFAAGIEKIRHETNGCETINAIRIPASIFAYLALARMSTTDSTTVLTWLKTQLAALGIRTIESYPEGDNVTMLAGSTVSTRKVVCYYNDSSENVELFIPEDLNFLEPQKEGLEEITIGTMTTGGLVVYTPLSIYLQWITTPA